MRDATPAELQMRENAAHVVETSGLRVTVWRRTLLAWALGTGWFITLVYLAVHLWNHR